MDYVKQLMDMGFSQEKAEYAVKITNNDGLEPAMEWLLALGDEKIPAQQKSGSSTPNVLGGNGATTSSAAAGSAIESTAKSFKCDECGKLFIDQFEVQFHAARTGHKNYSESEETKKPLTEEEKKRQLAMIDERLKRIRDEREQRDAEEAIAREKKRLQVGKDLSEAHKKSLDRETLKSLDQLKKLKDDETAARERVRAQIAADKAERQAKERSLNGSVPTVVEESRADPKPSGGNSASKKYKETRLQIRLLDGSTLTQSFDVREPLSAIRVYVTLNSHTKEPFSLMTTHPRKIFNTDDYEMQLQSLGLVPSAVLIVTRAKPN